MICTATSLDQQTCSVPAATKVDMYVKKDSRGDQQLRWQNLDTLTKKKRGQAKKTPANSDLAGRYYQ